MSRLDTVLRVAALRESAARAQVATAQLAQVRAEHDHAERLAAVRSSVPGRASAPQTQVQLAEQLSRAGRASSAAHEVLARDQERRTAVAGWSDAARSEQLLDSVLARHRDLARLGRERTTQRLVDDLHRPRSQARR